MLNRAPSVYVPVEPEDNGIAMPAILSLIVHGAVLALIYFTYQVPEIDNKAIETTIITPEELASLEANIKAKRETIAAGGVPETPEISTETVPSTSNDSSSSADDSVFSRSLSSVFGRTPDRPEAASTNSIDNEPVYEQTIEPDVSPATEEAPTPSLASDNTENPQTNKSPSNSTTESAKVGQLEAQFPATSVDKGAKGSASTKSKGQIASDLLNYISPRWNPDQKFVGTKITAYIKVDDNGNVLSVTTNAKDKDLGDSLIEAIKQASPLTPIAGSGYTKLEPVFVVTRK
ncbi:cell envelope integrity protein TolA [Psychrobacter sp.]|uniref:cell envelope integrity protein TolA n=1 Tax=Psychrobacter sp. TaxID=56811 RepID=UPI0025E25739|nr:cell envelope integrity protein TolA [Psychrobacter sp.]